MKEAKPVIHNKTLLTDDDLYLFNEGTHYRLFEKLGAHILDNEGDKGTHFAVWAPNAKRVFVMGDFNGWAKDSHELNCRGQSGIWEGFVPGVGKGTKYKYYICSRFEDYRVEKVDPFAFYTEISPRTASIVWDLGYEWQDEQWMSRRAHQNAFEAPISIYEVHLGSWMRVPEEHNRSMTYREVAHKLVEHVYDLGFTHVEFMPVMEHPFYGSWGYQTTGYYAPTSRYGEPQDFMYLVDCLHRQGIGVILDWVPSHFAKDEYALGFFDGTHLYEHADPRQGVHPEWDSLIFNYGRNEVRSFLISSAIFWLDVYHADGLRVDGVASMLYLDYGRKEGEWIPNEHGGRENIQAIDFLRRLNQEIYTKFEDVVTVAEESTAWPMVTRPSHIGGLGFGMKWDMGWMHDTLDYISKDPVYRKHHHDRLTFRMLYAFTENFILPLSHDEVVYGKGSLLRKMPGDNWQKFANLRLLFAYMFAQCGKKLVFMGGEFGQWDEWYHEKSLDWHLLELDQHRGIVRLVRDLNRVYKKEPALHELDFEDTGFEWIDCNDSEQSALSFVRKGKEVKDVLLAVFNFIPVPRPNCRIGSPRAGVWKEILNTDARQYGGSGLGNLGQVEAEPLPYHGRDHSLLITLPPLGAVFFKLREENFLPGSKT